MLEVVFSVIICEKGNPWVFVWLLKACRVDLCDCGAPVLGRRSDENCLDENMGVFLSAGTETGTLASSCFRSLPHTTHLIASLLFKQKQFAQDFAPTLVLGAFTDVGFCSCPAVVTKLKTTIHNVYEQASSE